MYPGSDSFDVLYPLYPSDVGVKAREIGGSGVLLELVYDVRLAVSCPCPSPQLFRLVNRPSAALCAPWVDMAYGELLHGLDLAAFLEMWNGAGGKKTGSEDDECLKM